MGFLASLTAMVFGWIPEGGWNMQHGMLLCASAILTASLASFGKLVAQGNLGYEGTRDNLNCLLYRNV